MALPWASAALRLSEVEEHHGSRRRSGRASGGFDGEASTYGLAGVAAQDDLAIAGTHQPCRHKTLIGRLEPELVDPARRYRRESPGLPDGCVDVLGSRHRGGSAPGETLAPCLRIGCLADPVGHGELDTVGLPWLPEGGGDAGTEPDDQSD